MLKLLAAIALSIALPSSVNLSPTSIFVATLNSYVDRSDARRMCVRPDVEAALASARRQIGTPAQSRWEPWSYANGHAVPLPIHQRYDNYLKAALKASPRQSVFRIERLPKPFNVSMAEITDPGPCNIDTGQGSWFGLSSPVVVGNLAFVEVYEIVHGTQPPPRLIILERTTGRWRIRASRYLWIG